MLSTPRTLPLVLCTLVASWALCAADEAAVDGFRMSPIVAGGVLVTGCWLLAAGAGAGHCCALGRQHGPEKLPYHGLTSSGQSYFAARTFGSMGVPKYAEYVAFCASICFTSSG